jgi:Domain of unknown function (DUF4365)
MAKKVTKQALIAERGVTLIKEIVLSMSSRWNPTESIDVGIDGTIELVDPDSGAALGALLAVQSKATEKKFKAETDEAFEWTCDEDDLSYWLQVNMPVLLIVSRPSAREAFWLCVQEHFRDAERRTSRTAHFDKKQDRFDMSCFPALLRLGRSAAANQELLLLRGPIEVLGLSDLAQRAATLTDSSKRADALSQLERQLREHGYPIQAEEVMARRADALITANKPREAADVWLELMADQLELGASAAPRVAIAQLGERVAKLSAEQKAKAAAIHARADWEDLGRPAAPISAAAKKLAALRSPWATRVLLWACEGALVDDDSAEVAVLRPRVKPFTGGTGDATKLRLWLWHADVTGEWERLVAAAGRLANADAGLVYCRWGSWLADRGQPDEAIDAFAQAAPLLARADLMGDAAECNLSRQWIQLESGPFPSDQDQDAVARTQLRNRRRLAGEIDSHVAFLEAMHDGELPRAHEFIRRALWEGVISGHIADERWAHSRMGDLFAKSGEMEAAIASYVLAGSAGEARKLAAGMDTLVGIDLQRLRGRPHRLGSAIAVLGAQADLIPAAMVRQLVPELLLFAHGVRQAPTSPTVRKEALDALAALSPMFSYQEATACLDLLGPAIPRPPATATLSDDAIQTVVPTVWEHHPKLRHRSERMLLEALDQPDLAPHLVEEISWIANRSASVVAQLRGRAATGNRLAGLALALAKVECPEATAEARRRATAIFGVHEPDRKELNLGFATHLDIAGQLGSYLSQRERVQLAEKYERLAKNRFDGSLNRASAVLGLRYLAPLLSRARQEKIFLTFLGLAAEEISEDSAFDQFVLQSQHPLSRTRLNFSISSLMQSSLRGAAELASLPRQARKLDPLFDRALTNPETGVLTNAFVAIGSMRQDLRPAVDWYSWASHSSAEIRASVASLWTRSRSAPTKLGPVLAHDPARKVRVSIAEGAPGFRNFGSKREYQRIRMLLRHDVSAAVRAAAHSWAA